MTQVKWMASLSDGETLYEGKGDFKEKEGELSPWQKLKQHLENNNLRITSIALYTDEGHRFNLPSKGNNPNFQAFRNAERPAEYNFFRQMAADFNSAMEQLNEEHFSVIEAIYKNNTKLQVWVKVNDPSTAWTLVI